MKDSNLLFPSDSVYRGSLWQPSHGYDLTADSYDRWYWQFFWSKCELPIIIELIKSYANKNSLVLDIGTGTGLYLCALHDLGIDCIGADISIKMLDVAKRKLCGTTRLICCDILQLPFKSDCMDMTIACRVISHVPDCAKALAQLARVTKIGGKAIITTVSSYHNYKNTRIPTPHGDVHIETFKHNDEEIISAAISSGIWALESHNAITRKDLKWEPPPKYFPSIDHKGIKPIFSYLIFKRVK